MAELFAWFGQFENSKPLALIIFFAAFCAVLIFVFAGGKRRARRLESHKYIPFADDDDAPQDSRPDERKVTDDER